MSSDIEDVEHFRQRARTWIRGNLGPYLPETAAGLHNVSREEQLAAVAYDRALQRRFFDAGFAGIAIPADYGGRGLTAAHQRAFNEELSGYEYPSRFQAPTMCPCAAVLLEFGTEEQKRQHIPAMLRGEELWMQFLSEPSGGSDVAAALTTAVRDGEDWVLNGAKIWTTGAWWSDWGLCLARTNWDVPKHRGLSVFILPIHQPGVEVHQIEMLNGARDFCQEFLTDVRVPDSDRIGKIDDGWTVGTRWMFHERMLLNSPYVTHPVETVRAGSTPSHIQVAAEAGVLHDARIRDLIGEARTLEVVERALQQRIGAGVQSGKLPHQAAAIGRLFNGVSHVRTAAIAFDIAGSGGAIWSPDEPAAAGAGESFLMRQVSCIGGGTTEMARNVISERVLGMPRESAPDPNLPFRDVPRGRTNR
ncbi:acyl-CoA dehydrogenase family protein [Nocardia miyunensis]|uniref:acyl-CoA dehydrogenase family protein n=1 Tax=Nocardia miyunensis TaxID=282684 RepID=UPI000834133B|nr:acyl-CoA dehydrogenase family protein [Nocardia miyunensis]